MPAGELNMIVIMGNIAKQIPKTETELKLSAHNTIKQGH